MVCCETPKMWETGTMLMFDLSAGNETNTLCMVESNPCIPRISNWRHIWALSDIFHCHPERTSVSSPCAYAVPFLSPTNQSKASCPSNVPHPSWSAAILVKEPTDKIVAWMASCKPEISVQIIPANVVICIDHGIEQSKIIQHRQPCYSIRDMLSCLFVGSHPAFSTCNRYHI